MSPNSAWQHWLEDRIRTGHGAEPLTILVDDEHPQLFNHYYLARMQGIPSRDLLLFDNAQEAIDFIEFAKKHQLTLAGLRTDYDNGEKSPRTGVEVLEALVDKATGRCAFGEMMLRYLISSDPREKEMAPYGTAYPKAPIEFYEKSDTQNVEGFFRRLSKQYARVARDQEEFVPGLKQHLDIFAYYADQFETLFQPFSSETAIVDAHSQKRALLDESRKMVDELIKITALLKQQEKSSGKWIINDGGQSPQEPVIIHAIGGFCLQKAMEMQQSFEKKMKEEQWTESFEDIRAEVTRRLENDYRETHQVAEIPEDDRVEIYNKSRQVVHSFKNVVHGISSNIHSLVDHLTEAVYAMRPPKQASLHQRIATAAWNALLTPVMDIVFPTHHFTYRSLLDLLDREETQATQLSFEYVAHPHPNRPQNTPGLTPERQALVLAAKDSDEAAKNPLDRGIQRELRRHVYALSQRKSGLQGMLHALTTMAKPQAPGKTA